MSAQKRMCCPRCGYKYGFRWIYIKEDIVQPNFLYGYSFDSEVRCPHCGAILYLEGASATFAKFMKETFRFLQCVNILFWMGVITVAFRNNPFWLALSIAVFCSAMAVMFVYLIPYLFNLLIVTPFLRGIGYISATDDMKFNIKGKNAKGEDENDPTP